MRLPNLRAIYVCAAVSAVCLAAGAHPGAMQRVPAIETFNGRAVDTTGPTPTKGGPIEILLERWSSDADDQTLRTALASGPEALLTALKSVSNGVAVVLSPGVQGTGARARDRRRQGLLFARDIKGPNGRRLIFATDEQLDFAGTTKERARPTQNEFTLLDIRFGADGKGVGKLGSVSQVKYNQQTKSFELENYDKLPAILVDLTSVKR
jgi:hypothetical protein